MKTTINGKEIKLFGRQELSAEFTKIVQEYLAKGFVINYSEASSGHQGEEMKLDLSNDGGKTVYRVWMDKEREAVNNDWNRIDVMVIFIEKFENAYNASTLWAGKGETVFEKKFYRIDEGYSKFAVYCENKEDYNLFYAKRKQRYEDKSGTELDRYGRNRKELAAKYNQIAIKSVRKMKGWKSALLKDIKRVDRRFGYGYEVIFNNGKSCYIKTAAK